MKVATTLAAIFTVAVTGAHAFSVEAPTTMSIGTVRKSISDMTAENFSSTLSTIEPFLLNDAGSTIYAKSMKRINVRAKFLGVEVPANYAKDAKATAKRREKQNAFIQVKEEERYEKGFSLPTPQPVFLKLFLSSSRRCSLWSFILLSLPQTNKLCIPSSLLIFL